ncbi:MAG: hypothetical protein JRN62_03255 [Nitrososphaerota archaeon]|jgi:hypothetical protein|nr:hypothetical protein [Nitrososphaerota archaeon]MDG6948615.1 hypothetical protein [Nitrososphaerota archaeon]
MVNKGQSPRVKVYLISEDEVRLEGTDVGTFFQFNFSAGHETLARIRYRKGGVLVEKEREKARKKTKPKPRRRTIDPTVFLPLITSKDKRNK